MPPPNILFFFPDQQRHDWAGEDPNLPLHTPNLDGLRRRGTTFDQAICPSPLCAPCRTIVATGHDFNHSPVQDNNQDLPAHYPTIYRLLRQSGYHVAGCGKFDLNKGACITQQPAWGLDGTLHLETWGFSDGINNEGKMDGANSGKEKPQGPYLNFLEERGLRQTHIDDFAARTRLSSFATPLPDDAYCDNWIGHNGLDLLQAAPTGKPWFLQVNFTGPHNPWDVTSNMLDTYAAADFSPPTDLDGGTADQHRAVRRNYAAMIANIDLWLGRYIEALEQRGELDNTLIVYSSDHGEMLGDRARWGKSLPFQASVGVPLVIAGPNVIQGRCQQPTTILDLPATFLDWADIDTPETMQSRSLQPVLAGDADTHRLHVGAALGPWRLVYDGRHKLIAGFEKEIQLYDLQQDPAEEKNLATDPAYHEVLTVLQAELDI
jgi:arylsulfatase